MVERPSIFSLSFQDVERDLEVKGQSTFRAKQLYDWLYRKQVSSFEEMSNLAKDFRKDLSDHFDISTPSVEVLQSKDGTRKYRFTLKDGAQIESVWIPEDKRNTLCISSQVGCALKCAFCVTGAMGFKRNLSPDEIISQVRHVKLIEGRPVSNVVFMGMGEPMLNRESVAKSIEIMSHDLGLQIGRRKITVSTAGVLPEIKPMIDATKVNLAISLTGTTNEERDYWMPINRKYKLEQLMETLRSLDLPKGKGVMFEVTIMEGKNDTEEACRQLARLIRGIPARVNLIPYNENPVLPHLKRPTTEKMYALRKIFHEYGIFAIVRKNRGNDIMAACGQLAGHALELKEKE